MMIKCQVCHKNEAEYAWQPFGPDNNLSMFTTLGSHYRGFPIIKVCQGCHDDIVLVTNKEYESSWVFVFHHKKIGYYIDHDTVHQTPF